METALVPVKELSHMLVGLTDCTDVQMQAGLAQELLYALGIDALEDAPPMEHGESVQEYIERLDAQDLATIEAMGIGRGMQMEEAIKAASRLILYRQYQDGRWQRYAETLDVREWSPYVVNVIEDCLRMSDGEGRRWATAIEVIAALYAPDATDRLGLTFQGPVVDHETGEILEDTSTEGLPPTAEDTLLENFSRYAREAGVKLRDLLRDMDNLPLMDWAELSKVQQQGILDDEGKAADIMGWTVEKYKEHRRLYKTVLEIRRILKLASSPTLSDKQVNREATGGKSIMPPLVLPEDIHPAWKSLLTSQYPELVSATGSEPMGQRYVQVRLTEFPRCKCGETMTIGYRGPVCPECGRKSPGKQSPTTMWDWRQADEYGHYSSDNGWHEGYHPEWVERAVPEKMDVHGMGVSVWELLVPLEELE